MDDSSDALQVDEPKRVMRTFASDMAALSGAQQTARPVDLPEPAPTPAPITPAAPSSPSPQLSGRGPVNALSSDEARSSILARLRARAEAAMDASKPATDARDVSRFAAIPEAFALAPTVEPVPGALPDAAAPIPATPVTPPPAPMPQPVRRPEPAPVRTAPWMNPPQERMPAPDGPQRIHTYTSDFADQIDEKQASAFAVLAAENDATRAPLPKQKTKTPVRTIVFTTLGVMLLIAGGAGVYYAVVSKPPATVTVAPSAPSLIFVDDRVAVIGTGEQLRTAILEAAAKPLSEGQVRLTYLTIATTTVLGTQNVTQTGGTLIDALALPAPDILLRHILPESTVGIITAKQETRPFFILRVDSYDRSFAGMLSWEATMGRDLAFFYPAYAAAALPSTASSTASTSPATSTSAIGVTAPALAAQFQDEILANHDVRALKDTAGRTMLLYGYADQQTLLITRNEGAFIELLNRLSATSKQ